MTPAPGGGPVVRFGDSALLVPVDSAPAAARVAAEVVRQAVPGVVDVVPALRSVLVVVEPALADPGDLAERLGALDPASLPAPAGRRHDVPTVFDGADLPEVADAVGARVEEVVETLAAATLVVATLGFSPGFAYLAGLPAPLDSLGRRATPRPTVPPGSVALAAGFAAVYPQATPGGWHLVGRSALTLFDPAAPLRQVGARRHRPVRAPGPRTGPRPRPPRPPPGPLVGRPRCPGGLQRGGARASDPGPGPGPGGGGPPRGAGRRPGRPDRPPAGQPPGRQRPGGDRARGHGAGSDPPGPLRPARGRGRCRPGAAPRRPRGGCGQGVPGVPASDWPWARCVPACGPPWRSRAAWSSRR